MGHQPKHINTVRKRLKPRTWLIFRNGPRVLPAVRLGASVGKGKRGGLVVVVGWPVGDANLGHVNGASGGPSVDCDGEPSVVDAADSLIHGDPHLVWLQYVRFPAEHCLAIGGAD